MNACRTWVAVALLLAAGGCGPTLGRCEVEADDGRGRERLSPVGRVLTIGSVSVKPKQEVQKFQPLADYLAEALKDLGVCGGRVVVAASVGEMAELLKKGDVDVYIDSPFPIVQVENLAGAVPMLRRWKNNEETYTGVVFARAAGAIDRLDDLKGRVIAFDEEFSTSGYLLPKGMLVELGLALMPVDDASRDVPSDQVGYVFSRDDENTLFWVERGKVAAGAANRREFERLTRDRPGDFVVLLETVRVPRQVVCRRRDLEPAVASALEQTLLEMSRSQRGARVLAEFEATDRFDRFPGGADRTLEPVRRLAKHLDSPSEAPPAPSGDAE